MTCRDELQIMLYVDGELPATEVAGLETHLRRCAACSRHVAALRAESTIIIDVLRETDAAEAPAGSVALTSTTPVRAPSGVLGPLWAGLAAACVSAGINVGVTVLAQLDAELGWLSPISEHRQISALFALFFALTEEDIPMLLAPVAAVAAVLMLAATLAFSARRRPFAAAGVIIVLLAATHASATELRRSADDHTGEVVIAAGETVGDTVVAFGKSVLVEGTITGDLVAFAQRVRVVGEVRGSLATLARYVVIEGNVGGDVYSLSQSLDFRGDAGRSLHAAAADLDIEKGARIERDALLASEIVRVGGTIGRDVRASGDVFSISGEVGRNVDLTGHVLDIPGTARVGGNLSAKLQSLGSFTRAPGAQLAHEPQIEENPPRDQRGFAHAARRWTQSGFYFWEAMKIAGALPLALLLFWLVPALFQWTSPPLQSLLRKGGIGFLALVATPIAAILVCITVIGLPIGILGLGAYLAALLLGSILVSLAVGQAIVRSPRPGLARVALPLLAGLVVVRIAVNLPYLGGIFHFLVLVIGLGLLLAQLRGMGNRLRTAPAQP